MIINELKAMTYDEFVKAGKGPSSGYDGYAATEEQAVAEDFPFEMYTSQHGAMSYAQWQAANG